jgi:hypothetical protein
MSIFARHASIGFRPMWSTPRDDVGEAPDENRPTIVARQCHGVDSIHTPFSGWVEAWARKLGPEDVAHVAKCGS